VGVGSRMAAFGHLTA